MLLFVGGHVGNHLWVTFHGLVQINKPCTKVVCASQEKWTAWCPGDERRQKAYRCHRKRNTYFSNGASPRFCQWHEYRLARVVVEGWNNTNIWSPQWGNILKKNTKQWITTFGLHRLQLNCWGSVDINESQKGSISWYTKTDMSWVAPEAIYSAIFRYANKLSVSINIAKQQEDPDHCTASNYAALYTIYLKYIVPDFSGIFWFWSLNWPLSESLNIK